MTEWQNILALSLAILHKIPSWKITNIAREENNWADALSKLASSALPSEAEPIYVEERASSALDQLLINEIHDFNDWRVPLIDYIIDNKILEDKHKSRSLIYKVRNYCMLNDKLYRRSLIEPLLRCIGPDEAQTAILEVHTSICGDHLGGKKFGIQNN